jgi:hypothetical protein
MMTSSQFDITSSNSVIASEANQSRAEYEAFGLLRHGLTIFIL